MPSSPSRAQPGRTMPKRAPLGEITASAANEISARVVRAEPWSPPPKAEADRNVFVLSPFPSKPAQVLLPSTVRKQRSLQNIGNAAQTPLEPERRPQVRLKRSVKTLRDLYEAQAEESSRPGTAISVDNRSSRPGTAGSRLRSQSSSEGLSGKYAWEHFKSLAAADELALLPSLPEAVPTLRHTAPRSSFAVRAKYPSSSSPNFRLHSPTLSPKLPIFRDLAELPSTDASDLTTQSSTALDEVDEVESSPNVVRLGPSSSMAQLPTLSELESFPDYRTLDTTIISPEETVKIVPPSSSLGRMASSSSSSSRKRKRAEDDQDSSSAAHQRGPRQFKSTPPQMESADLPEPLSSSPPRRRSADLPEPLSSSPPLKRPAHLPEPLSSSDPVAMQSSPPEEESASSPTDDSSPVLRVLNPATSSPERQSVTETHASLQDALFAAPASSSSPEPSDQHPVIRAPLLAQMAGLMVPKRRVRSPKSTDALEPRWPVRLSADTSLQITRTASPASVILDEEDELGMEYLQDIEVMNDPTNNSQVRIIPDSERHEGEDEVAALPGDDHDYRTLAPGMIRGNSYLSASGSSMSHANSLQSSFDSSRRKSRTSFVYSQHRPDSSGSVISVVVPTWARRYYSGCYPDSFRILAASTSNVSLATAQQSGPVSQRPASSTASRRSRPSFHSVRQSVANHISSIVNNRPRLAPRKSHTMPGIGPLVSNPVREGAAGPRQLEMQVQELDPRSTIRPVSLPPPIDPRAHWKDAIEDFNHRLEDRRATLSAMHVRPSESDWLSNGRVRRPLTLQQRISHLRSTSPHLHHDHRLNTGSTASRGFGFPFNRKANQWSPPSIVGTSNKIPGHALYRAQTVCYLTGFVFPISWFIGAALPLPPRPEALGDIEKAPWQRISTDISDWEEFRNQTKAKGRQETLWQNAKWWRTLNRYMCVIGTLVIILIIVLAVVGTRNKW